MAAVADSVKMILPTQVMDDKAAPYTNHPQSLIATSVTK